MRSLLLVAAGGGAFTPPPVALEAFNLTSAPEGGWTEIAQPQAVHYNGQTYFAWVNGTTGDVKIAQYDHASQTVSTPFVLHAALGGEGTADNHDEPSILVRNSDKRLIVSYCRHADSTIRQRISTNPEDATAFGSEVSLDSQLGGGTYDYPTVVQLLGVSGDPIYLLYRDYNGTGRIAYSVSTDDGATWSAQTILYTGPGGQVPYWRIGTDWSTRIDIFTTNKAPSLANALGHFYIDGTDGSRHQTDGTPIAASLPLVHADITEVASGATHSIQTWGHAYDGGDPACIFMAHSPSDNAINVARWNGSSWDLDEVLASVGGQLGINDFGSGCAIDPDDPDAVYIPRKISGTWEMWRYTKTGSWSGQALTASSSEDNVWPALVYFADELRALWLRGDYTNDTHYDFGISGARTP